MTYTAISHTLDHLATKKISNHKKVKWKKQITHYLECTTNIIQEKVSESTKPKYQCIMCGEIFLKKEYSIYKIHLQTHNEKLCHKCNYCGLYFSHKCNLTMHIHYNSSRPYNCEYCKKQFYYKQIFVTHVRFHTKQCLHKPQESNEASASTTDFASNRDAQLFRCNDCGETFTSKNELAIHIGAHLRSRLSHQSHSEPSTQTNARRNAASGKQRFGCDDCGQAFASRIGLTKHLRKHSRSRPIERGEAGLASPSQLGAHEPRSSYQCQRCCSFFANQLGLDKHNTRRAGRPYTCDTCSKAFCSKLLVGQHVGFHTGERPHKCIYCDRPYARLRNLARHLRLHGARPAELPAGPHSCQLCSRRFRERWGLERHACAALAHKCELCKRAYGSEAELKSHLDSRHFAKSFLCIYCDRTFCSKTKYDLHSVTHFGKYTYECTHCGKSFNCKRSLKYHIFVHIGYKPYTCNVCGKGCIHKGALKTHMITHSVERPFKCELCPKAYKHSCILKRHMMIHNNSEQMNIFMHTQK